MMKLFLVITLCINQRIYFIKFTLQSLKQGYIHHRQHMQRYIPVITDNTCTIHRVWNNNTWNIHRVWNNNHLAIFHLLLATAKAKPHSTILATGKQQLAYYKRFLAVGDDNGLLRGGAPGDDLPPAGPRTAPAPKTLPPHHPHSQFLWQVAVEMTRDLLSTRIGDIIKLTELHEW